MALREAARNVLERKGYAETTLRDIIDESDITHPTFYKYFASKEDVLGDLIEDLVERLVAAAIPATFPEVVKRSRTESSLRQAVRLGFRALLKIAGDNRQLLRAIREAIHSSPRHAKRWDRFRARALEVVEGDLAWAERTGIVRCEDRAVLAMVMVGTMEAAIFDLATREDSDLSVIEAVLESFYWNALLGWRGGLVDYAVVRGKKPRPVFVNVEGAARPVSRRSSQRSA